MKFTLVTTNKNKLNEFREILSGFEVKSVSLDIDEVQSMDLKYIVSKKVKEAYDRVKEPVIVEDTGFFLDELNGLPGPFIKYFEEILGNGSAVKLLGNSVNRKAKQICCVGYFDGLNEIIVFGEMVGEISQEVRLGEGFGFDFCFIPQGYSKTFSELGLNEKNKISARKKAIENLKEKIMHLN